MFRCLLLSLIFLGIGEASSFGAPPRFQFKKGDILSYKVVQVTTTEENFPDEKGKLEEVKHSTKAEIIRKWRVLDVDEKGVATLEMSIDSLKWQHTLPDGKEETFDSDKPDELNKKEMAKMVNTPLAILKIDSRGQLLEVKQSKAGPESRFYADLPFKIIFPESDPKVGQSWTRDYALVLEPPHGTGEKFDSQQTYTLQEPKGGLMVIALNTSVKKLPNSLSEQIPLIPLQTQGDVFFHSETGRYVGARIKVTKEIKDYQGEGSKYKFTSTYSEDLVPSK
ncbi:MAG: hypothetical protein N2112_03295 [Gemmataceae bacterium]|jgi:hypothetical protein|nr:hypothetical protein [Gemmataceae bacterium]